jgi:peptide/nickel transport system ATP-binding protein
VTGSPLLSVRDLNIGFRTAGAQPEPVLGVGEHPPVSTAGAQPEPVLGVGEHPPISTAGALPGDGPELVAAVRDIGFDLRSGQVLALVGESGSGKSATALAILGLLPGNAVVSGSARLSAAGAGLWRRRAQADQQSSAGVELIGAPPRVLRAVRGGEIGAVFQEPATALNPVFTVGYQIAEAIRAHRTVSRRAARARARELLGTVGLADPERIARAYPHELSGGQVQRATIAMAISCEPRLLIADEPTTALDVTVQAGILELLRDLRTRLGLAIVLITHDMGVVADLADEVVVLRDGRIVERAPAPQLFAAPAHEYTRALLAAVPRLDLASTDLTSTDLTSTVDEPDPGDPAAREVAALTGVVVDYRSRDGSRVRAVDGVSLSIRAGEVLGLVGESGSGKSTIGRVLAGLVPVAAGDARVAGTDIAHAPRRTLRAIRARTGIVFQDPASSLDPRRTVGDSIAEPLVLHTEQRGAVLRGRVDALLDAVALPAAFRTRYPHEMSGGQRQRIAIARALALGPDLLIADEPTSALDVTVQARILDLLRDLQRRFGFGCLFVSHDLALTRALADRVAVMYQGRIVETGPTAAVLREPREAYTRRLLAAAPVADPAEQARRRDAWRTVGPAA